MRSFFLMPSVKHLMLRSARQGASRSTHHARPADAPELPRFFHSCHENKRSCSGSGPCAYSLRSIFMDRGARRAALVVSEDEVHYFKDLPQPEEAPLRDAVCGGSSGQGAVSKGVDT